MGGEFPKPQYLHPNTPIKIKNMLRKLILGSFLFIALGVGSLALSNLWVVQSTQNQVFSKVKDVPDGQVALLLGTNPRIRNTYKNPYFTNRIAASVALYKAGKVKHFILSGDNSREAYNEPEAMQQALLKAGIPLNKMTLDYAGFRTLDSVVRSKAVFQQEKILIISQNFHNYRALFIANHEGIEAIAFDAKRVYRTAFSKVKKREYIARALAVLDLYVLQREPKFYGKKINIEA